MLESLTVETFSEIIGPLFFRVDLQNTDVSVGDMTPEEVPFDKEVLRCSVGDSLLGCKKKSAVVVFEHTTSNRRFKLRWKLERSNHFTEERSEWKERSHAGAEG